jgi:hypothetical protein
MGYKFRNWHFFAVFFGGLAVAVPAARTVKFINGPQVVKKTEYRFKRVDVGTCALTAQMWRKDFLSWEDTNFRAFGGGTITVVEDATDETARFEYVSTAEPTLEPGRKTEDNVIRVDLVVHVNPKAHYPTPGNRNVWVTEKQIADEAKQKAYTEEVQKRREPEWLRIRAIENKTKQETDRVRAIWKTEDAMHFGWQKLLDGVK